jgi:hypothetical protein
MHHHADRAHGRTLVVNYRMCLLGGNARQLLPDDHPLLRGSAWSKYHCAVTRQKDSEAHAVATRLDCAHPGEAVVSLDTFLDGTSLRHIRPEFVPYISVDPSCCPSLSYLRCCSKAHVQHYTSGRFSPPLTAHQVFETAGFLVVCTGVRRACIVALYPHLQCSHTFLGSRLQVLDQMQIFNESITPPMLPYAGKSPSTCLQTFSRPVHTRRTRYILLICWNWNATQ